jgi:hypothetical protein
MSKMTVNLPDGSTRTVTLDHMKVAQFVTTAPTPTPQAHADVAGAILIDAANIVTGDRESTHGNKERSFNRIALLWNAYLESRPTNTPLTAVDTAQMMVLLKIARALSGNPTRDHYLDEAAYAAIAGELAGVTK